MKKVVLWTDVHKGNSVSKFQAIWKGRRLRQFFNLSGPGVLTRSNLANDEDLVTCVAKEKQNPFDYFGLEENGKTWWFDIATIFDWTTRSASPTNPYTRVPIPNNDLMRMHRLNLMRRRWKLSVNPECKVYDQRMARRWTSISHLFRYYGFEDVHPETLANLRHGNLYAFFRMLRDDLIALNRPPHRIIYLCTQGIEKHTLPTHNYLLVSTTITQMMLLDTKSYDVVFLIMSALYRC